MEDIEVKAFGIICLLFLRNLSAFYLTLIGGAKPTRIEFLFPYVDKHNPWSSHSIIAGWLKEAPAGATVLDVGTASGTLGRLCQGKGLQFVGIEPNPEWAEMARPFYLELFVGSVQSAPDEYFSQAGVIVLADVLEHLAEPQSVLSGIVSQAKVGCLFIVSVPNVANLWDRIRLLFGHFDYTERGILDQTHLRFFTQDTLFDLLQKSGLRIQRCVVTPVPLDLVNPFFEQKAFGRRLHQALAQVTRWFPTLLGYQFVVLAINE